MRDVLSHPLWSGLAIAGVLAHAVLFAMLHVLEPGLDPARHIISDYGETGSAGLARAAFVAFAICWLALAAALSVVRPAPVLVTAGRGLFAFATLAILWVAIDPASSDPRTPSLVARLQNLAARPGLFVGVLLVSLGLRGVGGWATVARWLVALAVLALVLLVGTIAVGIDRGWGGLGQRAIFALLYAWIVIVALRTRRTTC